MNKKNSAALRFSAASVWRYSVRGCAQVISHTENPESPHVGTFPMVVGNYNNRRHERRDEKP
jgi:hypothetical protein